MLTVNKYLSIICVLIAIALTAYITSTTYQLKISKIQKQYLDEKNAVLVKQNEINQLNTKLTEQLKQKESEYYEKFSSLQSQNESLRADVASTARKLRVKISSCSSASAKDTTPGVDDGATSIGVIDARDAQSIIAITNKADKYKSQLESLQKYINDYNINIDKLNEGK